MYQRPSKSSVWLVNTNYTIQITLKIALRAVVSPVRTSLLLRRFVFRMAEASAKRVTGDEPQGTMGRVQTAGEADVSPVVSFPPSIARIFSSKERRLGTRQSSDATLRGERMTARRVAQT